ncbi:FTR1 family protein [Melioribacteraceae bacterium 4301-Me]|uniref:FTR1 family protein n=1 Tax=Pyranulibacter aquaticus TaxID=3163344 RepID=UPI0035959293
MFNFSVKPIFILSIYFFIFLAKSYPGENNLERNVRTLITLLDYIGTDYRNAIENGKVINEIEYSEMNDFAEQAESIFNNLSIALKTPNIQKIKNSIKELNQLIKRKADKEIIFKNANDIKQKILSLNLIAIFPLYYPSITNGKKVYQQNCVNCHGQTGKGDGPAAASLIPKPANFLNDSLMNNISPFQIYNTVQIGIKGTSMVPFNNLDDKQIWDVAFYISSLRYKNKFNISKDSINKIYSDILRKLSLEQISTMSDKKLSLLLKNSFNNDSLYLAAIRLYEPQKNSNISIAEASKFLDDALIKYKSGKYEEALDQALSAYLERVEPFEQQLSVINSDLKTELEQIMTKIRNDIRAKRPENELNDDIIRAKRLINNASSLLSSQNFSFWFSFLLAASILLREGLEAFLIIATILSVLKSLQTKHATKWVHYGWITALFIGILSMFFTNLLTALGAQSRELMEGIGSVLAVIILLYVGFWLHSKTEAKRWKEFIEGKIARMVEGNNKWGLALISFIVVFREAFESAIFLSAVSLESSTSGTNGVYFGAALTLIFVLILSWIAIKFTARLPIKKLFQYSALTIAILSVVLAGKGVHALQESGYYSSTFIPYKINFSLLGIYPTIETIAAQVIVLVLTIILWKLSDSSNKKVKTPG